jgi:SulP family sulfate permease
VSTIGRFVPGLATLASYQRSWLTPDLIAGVTVWAVLVPQGLGYASLAGLPTVVGLYAALGAMLLYWLWGSSRELNVGPESTVAIMVATVLAPLAQKGTEEYASLAAMLAILVGLVLLFGGLLRLGWIADLLSRPILAGYVFGSGLLIIGSQLVALFGLEAVDTALYAFDLGAVIRNLDQTNILALAIGLGAIAVVLGLRRLDRRIPGALVVVVGSIVLVALFGLEERVEVVGSFPSGVPMPSLPSVGLDDVLLLIGPAFAIALLVYPDSVLTARSLSTVGKYRLEPDREFFGIGAANVGSGLLTGFPVNGSQSRSFVVQSSGSKSQVSSLWASLFVVLTLVLLAWVFEFLPSAALAGIVIVAGLGLLDITDFRAIYRYRPVEFWLGVFTAVAVLVVGMLAGIIIAVALSLALVLQRAAAPSTAILGRIPGTDTYRDVADHPEAEPTPGLFVYRFDAPLFFANAGRLRDEILSGIEASDPPAVCVVLDMESIYDIDSTGAQTLLELIDGLDEQSVRLVFARVRTELRDELQASGIEARIGTDRIYLEVDDAVTAEKPARGRTNRSSRPSGTGPDTRKTEDRG